MTVALRHRFHWPVESRAVDQLDDQVEWQVVDLLIQQVPDRIWEQVWWRISRHVKEQLNKGAEY